MLEKSNEINELAKSLCSAQSVMGNALKDSANPYFKSKYADLTSVIEALREPFSKNGLSFTQLVESEGENHRVTTILMHSSGQFISGSVKLCLSKNDMQGLGSAISYARRYGLQAIAGLGAEDDDGEKAVGRNSHVVVEKALEEIKDKHLPDLELDNVSRVVFKNKSLFQNWLLKKYGTIKMTDLTKEQINEAKNILTDCKDNGVEPK